MIKGKKRVEKQAEKKDMIGFIFSPFYFCATSLVYWITS
jgi:hypothetical protein